MRIIYVSSKTCDGSYLCQDRSQNLYNSLQHSIIWPPLPHSPWRVWVHLLPQDIAWTGSSPWNDIIPHIPVINSLTSFYFFYSNATFTIKLTIIILFKIEILSHLAFPIHCPQLYIFLSHSICSYLTFHLSLIYG